MNTATSGTWWLDCTLLLHRTGVWYCAQFMNDKLYLIIITIIINQQKKQLSLCPLFVFPAQRQQSGAQGQEKPSVTNGRAQRRSECKSLMIFVSRWTFIVLFGYSLADTVADISLF